MSTHRRPPRLTAAAITALLAVVGATVSTTAATSPAGATVGDGIDIRDDTQFAYAGDWQVKANDYAHKKSEHWSNSPGATVTIAFTGTGIEVQGTRGPETGILKAATDGGAPQTVDLYQKDWRSQFVLFSRHGLKPGHHTLTLTVAGEKNPEAAGAGIWIDKSMTTTTAPTDCPADSKPGRPPAVPQTRTRPGTRPFVDSSTWNQEISRDSVVADEAAFPIPSDGNNYGVDWGTRAPAVVHASPGDPEVCVHLGAPSWGNPPGYYWLRIPRGVTGSKDSQGELIVVDGTTVWSFLFFERKSDVLASAGVLAFTDRMTGAGWGTRGPDQETLGAGTTEVGSSLLAGLIVKDETDAGEIGHALQLIVDRRDLRYPDTPLKPATGKYGAILPVPADPHPGPPRGMIIHGDHLKPATEQEPPGLSPLGRKVFRALSTYGAYVVGASDQMTGFRMQSNAYSGREYKQLWADAGKIIPTLRKVWSAPTTRR